MGYFNNRYYHSVRSIVLANIFFMLSRAFIVSLVSIGVIGIIVIMFCPPATVFLLDGLIVLPIYIGAPLYIAIAIILLAIWLSFFYLVYSLAKYFIFRKKETYEYELFF